MTSIELKLKDLILQNRCSLIGSFFIEEPRLIKILISLVILPGFRKALMKENTVQGTAVEMAASIGSDPKQIGENWKLLGMKNLDITEQLAEIGSEIPVEDSDWQKLLSQAGTWMIDLFDQKIESLQAKVVEQETAIELRKLFGTPLSLLAMPVFMKLEKMELLARMDLKIEAINIEKIWEQISSRVLYMIQLFLAEQISAVEKEEEAHLLALKSAQNEAKGLEALSGTMHQVNSKFDVKLDELRNKKASLLKNFQKISGNIRSSVESSFEQTIFSASRQSTQPIAIN